MADPANLTVQSKADQANTGFYYALSAFFLWGLLPFFMKAVAHIGTLEVLAHRVIWSIPIALALLVFTGRLSEFVQVIKTPRSVLIILVSASVISINWGTYVWAIASEHSIEAALGYYINPLITVALGAIFLGEKIDKLQAIAIFLAALAVIILTLKTGAIPLVAITVACSFAAYGFIRKTVSVGPTQGFLLEVIILSFVALPYLLWLSANGQSHFGTTTPNTMLLLGCGPVTAIPLILFTYGARRLRLSTIGFMQYLVPTMIFIIGVFIFNEPFDQWQLLAFVLIWVAIGLYSRSMVQKLHHQNESLASIRKSYR